MTAGDLIEILVGITSRHATSTVPVKINGKNIKEINFLEETKIVTNNLQQDETITTTAINIASEG